MQVTLFLLKKDGSTAAFALPSTVTLIGRRQECDLSIPLPIISRKHCEVIIDKNKLLIRDLHSKNGTFVNGQQVEEGQLSPGDHLQLGPVTFAVQINGIPAEITNTISFEESAVAASSSEPEEHFDEFKDIGEAQLGSSHTAEIPDIITDDLSQSA